MSSFAALKNDRQARQKPLITSIERQSDEINSDDLSAAGPSSPAPKVLEAKVDYGLPDSVVMKSSATRGRGLYVGTGNVKKGERAPSEADSRLGHSQR